MDLVHCTTAGLLESTGLATALAAARPVPADTPIIAAVEAYLHPPMRPSMLENDQRNFVIVPALVVDDGTAVTSFMVLAESALYVVSSDQRSVLQVSLIVFLRAPVPLTLFPIQRYALASIDALCRDPVRADTVVLVLKGTDDAIPRGLDYDSCVACFMFYTSYNFVLLQ
jgi:hypothetical protein